MHRIIDQLLFWIDNIPGEFRHMSELKRVKKCDSANTKATLSPYDQVHWVKMKGYQELPFDEVWVSLNKKLNMLLKISLMKSLLYKVALKIIN